MNIGTIRWFPVRELDALTEQMTRMFGGLAGDGADAPNWTPATDVFETADAYVVRTELAGISVDDIDIQLDDDVLTIRGQRALAPPPGEATEVLRAERGQGAFARSTTLPAGVQADAITAQLTDGVLEVLVPKAPEVRPRKIAVTLGGTEG